MSNGESLYHTLLNAAADGIIIINYQGIIQSFSPAAERLFGYAAEEVINRNVSMLMPVPVAMQHDSYLDKHLTQGNTSIIGSGREVVAKRKDGSLFDMHLSVGRADKPNGIPSFVGNCHDLTEYKQALKQLHQSDIRYQRLFDSKGLYILRMTLDGDILLANSTFEALYVDSGVARSTQFVECLFASSRTEFRNRLRMLRQGGGNEFKLTLTLQIGAKKCEVEWWLRQVSDDSDSVVQAVGIDVSEKVLAANEAFFLKYFDTTTKLPNLDFVRRQFPTLGADVGTDSHVFVQFELSNFKRMLKLEGNFAVSEKLRLITDVFDRNPNVEIASRISESVFLVVYRTNGQADFHQCVDICFQNLQSIVSKPTVIGSEIRAGCAAHNPGDSFDMTYQRSEMALMFAIQRQSQLVLYSDEIQAEYERTKKIEKGFLTALKVGAIDVYMQPKINLNSGKVAGYEALMRWQDSEMGFVSPLEIIKVVHDLDLVVELDKYIVSKVLGKRSYISS